MKPSLVQKHTHMRLYKTLARFVLSYGREPWTMNNRDKSRITASEMRFMRQTAGYTKWDHKRKEDILHELHIEPVLNYIHQYQNNWIQHVCCMPRTRCPRTILNYRPSGKRSLGCPMKK